jgi:hypothetical protein
MSAPQIAIIALPLLGIALGWTLQQWRMSNLRAELRREYLAADGLRSIISGMKPWLSGQSLMKQTASSSVDSEPLSASSVPAVNVDQSERLHD